MCVCVCVCVCVRACACVCVRVRVFRIFVLYTTFLCFILYKAYM